MANTHKDVKEEISGAVAELQMRLKGELFGHGNLKKIAEKTGYSKYIIRRALKEKYPSLEVLEVIEKALTKSKKAA